MRFIQLTSYEDVDIAINVDNITSIKKSGHHIIILMSGDKPITTQFTNIQNAVDYIQRAPSISLTQGD